jgi:hypothetical protein
VFEDCKKLALTRVFNCTGKPAVPQHPLDIEAFHSNYAVAIYQFDGDLVMLITAGIGNTGIKVPYPYALFFPEVAPLPLTAKAALLYTQFSQHCLKRLNCGFPLTASGRQKRFKAHIYSRCRLTGSIRNSNIWQLAGGDNIPFITFALERDCFDLTFDTG